MDKNIFYVYQLRLDIESSPFYIGKGKNRRAWEHLLPCCHSDDSHKSNKIRKAYREDNIILVEFLRENVTEKQAHRLEKYWIAKVGRSDLGLGPLTNHTNGGDGVSGQIVSEETRLKLSIASRGENNPMFGRTHSVDTKAMISQVHKGKTFNHSEETRKKISDASSKHRHPESTKLKIGELKSKSYTIVYPDGRLEEIKNLTKFCREQNLDQGNMSSVANGKSLQHKGYKCYHTPESL